MAPTERLVELNNISTPWDVGDAQSIGGVLLPQSWILLENQLVPYEFCYLHGDAAYGQQLSQEATLASLGGFLDELYAKLVDIGIHDLLGLRLHPGLEFDGLVEVTVGRANINFHPSKVSSVSSFREFSNCISRCHLGIQQRQLGFSTQNISKGAVHASATRLLKTTTTWATAPPPGHNLITNFVLRNTCILFQEKL